MRLRCEVPAVWLVAQFPAPLEGRSPYPLYTVALIFADAFLAATRIGSQTGENGGA